MEETKKGLDKIRELSSRVAVHFCENESSFKLEEFVSIMKSFFEKIKQCEKVNFIFALSKLVMTLVINILGLIISIKL